MIPPFLKTERDSDRVSQTELDMRCHAIVDGDGRIVNSHAGKISRWFGRHTKTKIDTLDRREPDARSNRQRKPRILYKRE